MKKVCVLFYNFLCIIIIFICFSGTVIGMNINNDNVNQLKISEEHQITNFNDFELFSDNELVNSYNYGDYIEFNYTGNHWVNQHEQYLLTLNDIKGCSDFSITTRFSYYADQYEDRITFRIFAGSYYMENGSYVSAYPIDSGGTPSKIVGAGIWDAWSANSGKHVAVAYPDNIKDRQETNYYSLNELGEVEVKLQRDGSTVIAKVNDTKDGSYQIDYLWSDGLNRQMNYILLDFYAAGNDASVFLEVMSIEGTFLMNEIISLPFSGFTIQMSLISLISILGLTWIYFSKNKSKKLKFN